MKLTSTLATGALLAFVSTAGAQLINRGEQKYQLSGFSLSPSPAGVVVKATVSPAPPEPTKLGLMVFAPVADVSLSRLTVAGGPYALTMDEAGDYFNFDLKADNGKGEPIGPLIFHELGRRNLAGGTLNLVLQHKLAVRRNEPFPSSGRLEIALAIEGKNSKGDPSFTIVSNSLADVVKVLSAERGASPTLRPADLLLGDSEGAPVVYFKPAAGLTLVLSQVKHDGFGQPESYMLEIGSGAPPGLTVQVRRDPAAKAGFVARIGEQTLTELAAAKSKDELVALNPAGAGGMVLAAPGELKLNITTEFAYDGFNRRQISAQTFVHAGAKWKVTFSDYTRDGFGRLTGCRAMIANSPDASSSAILKHAKS